MQEFRLSAMEERNYGIDLLRIVSMMMVVLLHVLGQGGILDGSDPLTVKSETAWLLEIGAYSAVNIYAMISGYVGYGRKYKYSGLVYLYFQVLFYTVPTTIIFYIYRPELVNLKGKRELLFPFAYNTYWYFTAYFCLAFFIPFLNMMLERLDRAELKRLLFFLCLIFSILPTLFYEDFPRTSSGYSFLWLAVLYLVGGYIKKYNTTFPGKGGRKFLGYLVCILVTWLVKVGVQYHIPRGENQPILYDYLISYTSPTIVLSGVPVSDLCEYTMRKNGQKDYWLSGTGFFWRVSSPRRAFDDRTLYGKYVCGVSDPESGSDGGSDPCYCFGNLDHRNFDRPDPYQPV